MRKQEKELKELADYYEQRDVLDEITDESVDFSLDERLRQDILSGKRKRKLKHPAASRGVLQLFKGVSFWG